MLSEKLNKLKRESEKLFLVVKNFQYYFTGCAKNSIYSRVIF